MHSKNQANGLYKYLPVLTQALTLAKVPILISLILTPIRFSLELAGLPESYIFPVGVLWLTLAFSIYWGVQLKSEEKPHIILLLALVIYSPISRLPVAILWWVDNKMEIGSHYGLYFDNFLQALLNQLFYGSLIQLVPGFLLGSISIAVLNYYQSSKK